VLFLLRRKDLAMESYKPYCLSPSDHSSVTFGIMISKVVNPFGGGTGGGPGTKPEFCFDIANGRGVKNSARKLDNGNTLVSVLGR
jgi:hypothetical protein